MKRILGLDSIRFVAAFIVFLSHGAFFSVSNSLIESTPSLKTLSYLIKFLLPNGPAAVTIFFVISGFVIHYPFRDGKNLSLIDFYIKRILRVLIPLLAAKYLLYDTIINHSMQVDWSIHCEIYYYLCYPLILIFRKYLKLILILSILISFSISIYHYNTNIYEGDLWVFGGALTWIVCYPLWIIGVLLADNFEKYSWDTVPSRPKIMAFRVIMYLIGSVLLLLRFHANIPYYFSMFPFAFLTYYWLRNEIIYYNNEIISKNEVKFLAYGGLFSYSIYLMGNATEYTFVYFFGENYNENLVLLFSSWLTIIIYGYIFYVLIEKPSHKLAKMIKVPFSKFKVSSTSLLD